MSYTKENDQLGFTQELIKQGGRDFLDHDPVGLPDSKDIENIRTIIRNHEKAHPGEIAEIIQDSKEEQALLLKDTGATKDNSQRRALSMPSGLLRTIEEAYPLMFQNRSHMHWFMKTFPEFNVARKI